eukprot:1096069-Amphidinium_carterae.2
MQPSCAQSISIYSDRRLLVDICGSQHDHPMCFVAPKKHIPTQFIVKVRPGACFHHVRNLIANDLFHNTQL